MGSFGGERVTPLARLNSHMRTYLQLPVSVLVAGLFATMALAQSSPGTPDLPTSQQAPASHATSTSPDGQLVGPEYVLCTAVLIFGVTVVGFVMFVMLRRNLTWDDASFKAMTLPLVVFSGLFLITAGYDQHQVAPMFGLLGTLVGYILGRQSNDGRSSPTPPTPNAR